MGQPTEKPVIVEALDLTFRTIEKRIKRYRNLVISVVIVTSVSVLLAIFYRQWLLTAGLILLVPLIGRFFVLDSQTVRRWRAEIMQMSRKNDLDLQSFVKTASELRKISPRTLADMLATIQPNPLEPKIAPESFDIAQRKSEKKAIASVVLLTAALICGAAGIAFQSGLLFILATTSIAVFVVTRR